MAFESITVGTIKTQLARKLCNSDTLDTSLATEATWCMQAALRELCLETHMQRMLSVPGTNITLVQAQAQYSMADDVFLILPDSVRLTAQPHTTLQPLYREDYDRFETTRLALTGSPTHFMFDGAVSGTGAQLITFVPTPSASGNAVTYRYVSPPASLLGAADNAVLDRRVPPYFHHLIVIGALRFMPSYLPESDWQKFHLMWNEGKQQAKRASYPLVGWTKQPDARTYTSPAVEIHPSVNWPLSP